MDPANSNYGRIPNLVTNASIAYNTADGTPRFVMALDQYVRYSGDTTFAREMYPVVRRSIAGTIRYHTDSLGFLTHGDAETWMDAVGPEGPWSPRGNRANDIQYLWARQMAVGRSLASFVGDTAGKSWPYERLVENFPKYFIDPTTHLLYDHLNADGTPDTQLRPNQLFVVGGGNPFHIRSSDIFREVTTKLVYPYGVASLWQQDPDFHPYHHYEPFYVQDAAYHNGIVWTWLAGAWTDLAAQAGRPDIAAIVTGAMVHQILDRGAAGTLSELLDAVPRPGEKEPRLSGAYSQAWSLAEFVRSFYQDYLGILPDETAGYRSDREAFDNYPRQCRAAVWPDIHSPSLSGIGTTGQCSARGIANGSRRAPEPRRRVPGRSYSVIRHLAPPG